jgi:hypothetical protein
MAALKVPAELSEPAAAMAAERENEADAEVSSDGFGMCHHPPTDMDAGAPAAALTSLAVLAVYFRTLSPSITGGDSGEVMAAACSWGPAHPPGYPLFVACANLAMWLFASLGENKAYRVNLMCAMMTAAGVYNLHRAARIVTGSSAAATAGAAMYGLSPLIWNNALQAEVFSMNNMFVCLVTHILVRYLGRNQVAVTRMALPSLPALLFSVSISLFSLWPCFHALWLCLCPCTLEFTPDAPVFTLAGVQPGAREQAYLGAFTVGLGLSNQHTLVLYAAVIVPVVFFSGWRLLLRPGPFLACTLLFALGMSPYSHMWWLEGCPIPWAEADGHSLGTKYCPQFEHVPRYSWGDRRSFTGFWNHLLRKDYGTFVLAAGGAEVHGKPVSLLEGLRLYLEDIVGPRLDERRAGHTRSHDGQLLYVGVPLALTGIVAAGYGRPFGRHLAACRCLLFCWIFYTVVFHSLANLPIRVPLFLAVHARFWQMPNSSLFLFVALGFEILSRRFLDQGSGSSQHGGRTSSPSSTTACAADAGGAGAEDDCQGGAARVGRGRQASVSRRDLSPSGPRSAAGSASGSRGRRGADVDTAKARRREASTGVLGDASRPPLLNVREARGGTCAALGRRGHGGESWKRWLLAGVLVWLQLIHNYHTQDQSNNYAMDFLTRTAIETLPPNAIVLCSGDLQFNPGLYLTACEGVRPDVAFLSLQLMSYRWYALNSTVKYPDVAFPGRSHWPDQHGYSLQKFFEANIFRRPIHVYGGNRPAETLERLLEDASLSEEQFYHWPWGLTDRMLARSVTPRVDLHAFARDHATAWAPMENWEQAGLLPDLRDNGEDTWEDQIVREFYIGYHRIGHHVMEFYQTLPGEDCGGVCPEGCDCDYTMGKTLELARHAYSKLGNAQVNYTARGLEVTHSPLVSPCLT